jgi:Uma2 family endonuclease
MMANQKLVNPPLTVLPLENGDRLSRAEFERRYSAMSQVKKAELIEGIVYMASPLRFRSHGQPHARIIGWLAVYEAATPGVELGDNATVRLDADNEPQPDALLRIDVGGRSQISDDDYVEGAPELIVEVAASTASYDLHEKLRVYRRNGVQEYVIWRVYNCELDWFQLRDGEYMRIEPNTEGIIFSEVFPGLCLDVSALLSGDLARVLEVLHQGLAAPEHQSFLESLAISH